VAPQRLGSTVGLREARARAGRSPRARDARRTWTQASVTTFPSGRMSPRCSPRASC